MSRSIAYAGRDLSGWTVAEWRRPAAHGMVVEAAEVPGRPGAAHLSSRLAPCEIRVRLYLDLPDLHPAEDLGAYRRELAAALFSEAPAELALPGEEGLAYRDAVCTDASAWSHLFSDGSCELVFVALDPVAWGAEDGFGPVAVAEASGSAAGGGDQGASGLGVWLGHVPGTAPTWPAFELAAAAGEAVEVRCEPGGEPFVRVERPFEGGEEVVIDCGAARAWVDGEAADADVALGSAYFPLAPGSARLGFSGVSSYAASYRARWY